MSHIPGTNYCKNPFVKTVDWSKDTTAKVEQDKGTTSTDTTYYNINPTYVAEKGWECPRCGHINAPWVRQCDCSRGTWTITADWTYRPERQPQITCDSDTFKIHPEDITYTKTPYTICDSDSQATDSNSTNVWASGTNIVVGGSDFWDEKNKTWTNVSSSSNTITRDDSPWNQFSTYTVAEQLNELQSQINKLKKETK